MKKRRQADALQITLPIEFLQQRLKSLIAAADRKSIGLYEEEPRTASLGLFRQRFDPFHIFGFIDDVPKMEFGSR
jgi:hypothetical protein